MAIKSLILECRLLRPFMLSFARCRTGSSEESASGFCLDPTAAQAAKQSHFVSASSRPTWKQVGSRHGYIQSRTLPERLLAGAPGVVGSRPSLRMQAYIQVRYRISTVLPGQSPKIARCLVALFGCNICVEHLILCNQISHCFLQARAHCLRIPLKPQHRVIPPPHLRFGFRQADRR